jgi:hypothetical protein
MSSPLQQGADGPSRDAGLLIVLPDLEKQALAILESACDADQVCCVARSLQINIALRPQSHNLTSPPLCTGPI